MGRDTSKTGFETELLIDTGRETCQEGGGDDRVNANQIVGIGGEQADETAAALDLAYAPRRSNRVSEDIAAADGDTWMERIAVCEGVTSTGAPQLLLRSYYRNSRTGARKWDEPPSGASKIQHATVDQRKKAELQMQELQLTLDMIPPDPEEMQNNNTLIDLDDNGGCGDGADGGDGKKKKKKGFLNFSKFRANMSKPKKKEHKQVHESQDLNLQRAIALSMADMRGTGTHDDPVVFYDPETAAATDRTTSTSARKPSSSSKKFNAYQEEDDDIAMAKALSMSEAEYMGGKIPDEPLSEEEMLRRAIEYSQFEAANNQSYSSGAGPTDPAVDADLGPNVPTAAAAVVKHNPFDGTLNESSTNNDFSSPMQPGGGGNEPEGIESDHFWNQKMPAVADLKPPPRAMVTPSPPTIPAPAPISFDPYQSSSSNVTTVAASNLKAPPPTSLHEQQPPQQQEQQQQQQFIQPQPEFAGNDDFAVQQQQQPPSPPKSAVINPPGKNLARRMFGNKKALRDEAGVV